MWSRVRELANGGHNGIVSPRHLGGEAPAASSQKTTVMWV